MSTLTPVRTQWGVTVHLVARKGLLGDTARTPSLCGRDPEGGWFIDLGDRSRRDCRTCAVRAGKLRRVEGATR